MTTNSNTNDTQRPNNNNAQNMVALSPIYEGQIFASPNSTKSTKSSTCDAIPQIQQIQSTSKSKPLTNNATLSLFNASTNNQNDNNNNPLIPTESTSTASSTPTPTTEVNSNLNEHTHVNICSYNNPFKLNKSARSNTSTSSSSGDISPSLETGISPVSKMDIFNIKDINFEEEESPLNTTKLNINKIQIIHKKSNKVNKILFTEHDTNSSRSSGSSDSTQSNISPKNNNNKVDKQLKKLRVHPSNLNFNQFPNTGYVESENSIITINKNQTRSPENSPLNSNGSTADHKLQLKSIQPLVLSHVNDVKIVTILNNNNKKERVLSQGNIKTKTKTKNKRYHHHQKSPNHHQSHLNQHHHQSHNRKNRKPRRKSFDERSCSDSESELLSTNKIIKAKVNKLHIQVPDDPDRIYKHWQRLTNPNKSYKNNKNKNINHIQIYRNAKNRNYIPSDDSLVNYRNNNINSNSNNSNLNPNFSSPSSSNSLSTVNNNGLDLMLPKLPLMKSNSYNNLFDENTCYNPYNKNKRNKNDDLLLLNASNKAILVHTPKHNKNIDDDMKQINHKIYGLQSYQYEYQQKLKKNKKNKHKKKKKNKKHRERRKSTIYPGFSYFNCSNNTITSRKSLSNKAASASPKSNRNRINSYPPFNPIIERSSSPPQNRALLQIPSNINNKRNINISQLQSMSLSPPLLSSQYSNNIVIERVNMDNKIKSKYRVPILKWNETNNDDDGKSNDLLSPIIIDIQSLSDPYSRSQTQTQIKKHKHHKHHEPDKKHKTLTLNNLDNIKKINFNNSQNNDKKSLVVPDFNGKYLDL